MSRIFAILLIVAVAIGGTFWYVHWSKTRAMNNGEVFVRDQPEENVKPAAPAAAPVAAVEKKPAPQEIAVEHPPAAPVAERPQEIVVGNTRPAPSPVPARAARAVPVSDTLPRNPVNGKRVLGSGRYQLYRQGDITWRLDTQTGDACILFATDAQWGMTRVYENGCGGG
jgi:hypothetical protein